MGERNLKGGFQTSTPRDLTRAEREVLEFLLSADFDGADRLRAQVPQCRVVAVWAAGQPSVDLAVPETVAPARVPDGEIPAGSEVRDRAGQYIGEVLVWVHGGYLSAIEYAWVTDDAPDRLPDVSAMTRLQPEGDSRGSGSDHAS